MDLRHRYEAKLAAIVVAPQWDELMPPIHETTADFGQPDEPEQVTVQLIVPEEFVAASMTELQFRGGCVLGMEVEGETVSIHASLPESEGRELREAIRAATAGRGRVESVPRQ